ncbi:UNKNOWN [Stylonychia lemnae]|uniref:Uncharacterized protein n=1 Tax=Stylonychia lemnae TaxID=5949 RepID=A0A078A164_STYLE|nr:UNKNOWN [Stylonychia lemnae]|eukprot:CDW74524.1 UNKNOWN [Stylonychia lemnae]
MILRNQAQIKKNTLVNISNSYTPPEDISRKNISFAFKLADFYGNTIADDSKHGKLILRQFDIKILKNDSDGTSNRIFNTYLIPFSKCQIGKNFFYENSQELELYSIDSYYCPDWNNLTIQGNWYAPEYKGLTLLYQRCSGSNCSSDDDFKSWFAPILVQEIFTSSYFNIGDFDRPIHYFLDNIWVNLQYGRSVVYQTFVKKNQIQLSDNLFGLFYTQVNDFFYEIQKNTYFTADDQRGPGPGVMFSQDIILDKEYDIFDRQVYTLTGVLQDIGGFYNSCFFVCVLLYSKIQYTLFFSSLVSRLYQIDVKPKSYSSKKNKYDMESVDQDSTITNVNLKTKQKNGSNLSNMQLHQYIQKNSKTITEDFLNYVQNLLDNRWRMKMSCKEACRNKITFFLCRPCIKTRHFRKTYKKERLFKKGEAKIKKELDCVNLMAKMRQIDIFLSYFFSSRQKFLMMFSKQNLLHLSESSQSEDEGDRIQRFIKKHKEYADSDSDDSNKHTHVVYAKQMQASLKHFKHPGQISLMDKRLLYGLLTKNPSKYLNHEYSQSSIENFKDKTNDKSIRDASLHYSDSDSVDPSMMAPYTVSMNPPEKTHQEFYTQGTIIKEIIKGQPEEKSIKDGFKSLRKMLQKKPKQEKSGFSKNKSRMTAVDGHHDKFTHTAKKKRPATKYESSDDNMKLEKVFKN